jgi:uncharacterized membrane protein YdjX (TVP38/TMEM64 family)
LKAGRIAWVLIIALIIPVAPFLLVGELPGDRWLSGTDDNAFEFGLAGAGLLAADLLIPVPSSLLGSMLGARLGFVEGMLWSWSGLMLGNLIGYGLGRLALAPLAGKEKELPALGPTVLFITRPVPVLAEAMTFTAGASRMGMVSFLLATALGNGLYALVLAGNGAALLPQALAGPGLAVPMLFPVGAWLLWRYVVRHRTSAQQLKERL